MLELPIQKGFGSWIMDAVRIYGLAEIDDTDIPSELAELMIPIYPASDRPALPY